jgi:hypothetical protein
LELFGNNLGQMKRTIGCKRSRQLASSLEFQLPDRPSCNRVFIVEYAYYPIVIGERRERNPVRARFAQGSSSLFAAITRAGKYRIKQKSGNG